MRTIPGMLVASFVTVTAACSRQDAPSVTIETRPLTPAQVAARSVAAVESGHHMITVRRTVQVADTCRGLTADLVRAASDLTLRVVAQPATDAACPPAETTLAYTAVIDGLRPGPYHLRVIHVGLENGAARVALEHPVLVLDRAVQVR